MSLLAFGAYFPEYVRARFSAGLIFSMLREQPKIDSLSESGAKPVMVNSFCAYKPERSSHCCIFMTLTICCCALRHCAPKSIT